MKISSGSFKTSWKKNRIKREMYSNAKTKTHTIVFITRVFHDLLVAPSYVAWLVISAQFMTSPNQSWVLLFRKRANGCWVDSHKYVLSQGTDSALRVFSSWTFPVSTLSCGKCVFPKGLEKTSTCLLAFRQTFLSSVYNLGNRKDQEVQRDLPPAGLPLKAHKDLD